MNMQQVELLKLQSVGNHQYHTGGIQGSPELAEEIMRLTWVKISIQVQICT